MKISLKSVFTFLIKTANNGSYRVNFDCCNQNQLEHFWWSTIFLKMTAFQTEIFL